LPNLDDLRMIYANRFLDRVLVRLHDYLAWAQTVLLASDFDVR
jgi:hypothetical protein